MKQSLVKARQIILLLGDLLFLYTSLGATLVIRYGEVNQDLWTNHFLPFSIVYLLWILIFYINDLYNFSLTRLEFTQRGFAAMLINAGLGLAFFYLVPAFGIAPRTNFFINIFVAGLLLTIWRYLADKVVSRKRTGRVLFLGEAPEEKELYKHLEKRVSLGYLPVKTIRAEELNQISITKLISENKIDVVVVSINLNDCPAIARELYSLLGKNINIVNVISFYEEVFSRIPISVLNEIWFLENIHEEQKRIYELGKRAIDFTGALLLGSITLILLPFIALAIKTLDHGPVFYKQKRLGQGRREFLVYKFRTMREGAETGTPQFASQNDSRVTRVGRFLRKTRLDELPQIWNILLGEMSFVGPRPERLEFVHELETRFPFYAVRHLVTPGLTGWAQIYYNYAASLEENLRKLQYDFFYIKNRSLLLDLMIMLKTLNIVMRFRGR